MDKVTTPSTAATQRWSVEHNALAGFAVSLLILAVLGAGTYRVVGSYLQASIEVAHSQSMLMQMEKLHASLSQILLQQQGIAIGIGERMLEQRTDAATQAVQHLQAIQTLSLSDSFMQGRIDSLTGQVTEYQAALDRALAAFQTQGPEAARRIASEAHIAARLTQIRVMLDEFEQHEQEVLTRRNTEDARWANRLVATFAGLLVAMALTLIFFYARIHQELRRRHTTETNLQQANAFLESLFDNLPIMAFVKDTKELRYVRMNRAGEQLLGVPQADIVGKNDHELVPHSMAEFFEKQDRETLRTGQIRDIPEEKLLSASGRTLTLHTTKVPMLDQNGKPAFLLGISLDISSRKASEAKILALNEQLKRNSGLLEASNQELESFCYSVSHDLRAPLRMITGYSAMLQEELGDELSDEARRYLRLISEGGLRMAQLIDDLLAFSRLGRKALTFETVEMEALVRRTVHELLAMAEPPHPQIRIDAMPVAEGDTALLNQVWINLIDNAIKYSARAIAPTITISGKVEDGDAVYRVRDNGVGFDMRYYDKLFGVFQRLHGIDEFPGTGVGLAIVQRIVARHGGRVWAQSQAGQGADFYFSLPLVAGPRTMDETTLPASSGLAARSNTTSGPATTQSLLD